MPNYDDRVFAAGGLGSISGTVATAPAGAVLGEDRWHNGVKYRLLYNAGTASITVGYVCSPVPLSTGFYSVAVSTLTNVEHYQGAAIVLHSTVPTGYYFWGAVEGVFTAALLQSGSTLVTGDVIGVGIEGAMNGISLASASVSGNGGIGYVVVGATAGTTAVKNTVTVALVPH